MTKIQEKEKIVSFYRNKVEFLKKKNNMNSLVNSYE